jgi:hypothetical protein
MATQEQIQQAIDNLNARYLQTLRALDDALDRLEQIQVPSPESVNEDELVEAARLMAISDLNKEDLSEAEIYKRLVETSDAEASAVGFWAVPLPTSDEPKPAPNKRYTTK